MCLGLGGWVSSRSPVSPLAQEGKGDRAAFRGRALTLLFLTDSAFGISAEDVYWNVRFSIYQTNHTLLVGQMIGTDTFLFGNV